ncbi:toxin-antitoxin system YwqK family antitoxin [Pedobacter gandavensis]|uniref:Toxin-antitoxin system YwqK family antitoxin n=1 Tax=Pedobacter gandavensis TaxID=2679963 RepID=A0ABR6ES87_9SPHI|nr:toxin-antitoxin system YwqK family antitoxin [Pedobacter gandavensis]MBB2148072.1 toxin-antitoxin system YwqK family antitoxin [Pedobacter gandavensis]
MGNLFFKLNCTFIFLCLGTTLFAQLPEEINWKHLMKTYNKDSTEMVLSLNGKLLEGKYKIPLEEGFALYNIKKGLITGEAFWYTQGGRMECKLYYKNGVRNGLKENYDHQDQVWLRQEYRDGKQDGISEMYTNGKIVNKSSYKAGKKDGLSLTYSGDQLSTEANYENDQRNGLYRVYNGGKIVTENNYKNDLQNGLSTTYLAGRKSMDSTYENGKRHGVSHMYKPDGSTLFENYYLFGEKVSKAAFEEYQQRDKK